MMRATLYKTMGQRQPAAQRGFTLVEFLVGTALLGIAVVALMAVFVKEQQLNGYSSDRSLALLDASRVMERLRQQNNPGTCAVTNVNPPAGFASWDAWLADTTANGGGGKNVQPLGQTNELIVVSPPPGGVNPIPVTVAVCWRERGRIIGECQWNGVVLSPNPGAGGDPLVTESQAMLSTVITCRR